jgi:superfamily II DNA or RNA helicase
VCGDESVGSIETDSFVAEAYALGIPTTTDQGVIAVHLSKPVTGRRITFTTYQSSEKLAEAARGAGVSFDLAVLDEAHRTVGAASKTFATLLRDDAISIQRRLFMTATERVLRGQRDDVLSMDDEAVYGERFFQLTFKDAIAQGIISDYRILTITVSDERVQEIIQQNRLIDLGPGEAEAEAEAVAAGIALKRVFQEYGAKYAISFHRSIKAADRFRGQQDRLNELTEVGPSTTNLHISSKKPAGERAELLRGFVQHERALMTNARCLMEGVDIPAIDCVLFADPKQSVVDIVQAAGRAMRLSKGKECGYILLPLIVPTGMGLDDFAETTAFKQVAKTITALSTQDERIPEEFRAVEHGCRSSGRIIEITGDVLVGLQLSLDEFASAIQAAIWGRVGRANWRPFEEARAFVRRLGLKSQSEWSAYCASDGRPPDIPSAPYQVYANQGWQGLGDWLGTGVIGKYLHHGRSFEEARTFVRGLALRSRAEWNTYCRSGALPLDIPSTPSKVYANQGWQGWGDWLGTGVVATHLRQYRSFEEARTFVRGLGLKSGADWTSYCNSNALPEDIPRKPYKTYAEEGWQSWGDWLGTGFVAHGQREFRSFQEARAFVRGLGLKSFSEWGAYSVSDARPRDVPSAPARTYANEGWQGWGDWLGTGTVASYLRQWRSFDEARAFVRGLGLQSRAEWSTYCRSDALPSDIPATPWQAYAAQGWVDLGDWLGTGRLSHRPQRKSQREQWRPFPEARAFVRKLGLKSKAEWVAYSKSGALPTDIPVGPSQSYAPQGWQGWGDWLGTGRTADQLRQYRPFEDARAFARGLNLKSFREWRAYCRGSPLPEDIPRKPSRTYANKGWQGWGDWLGTGTLGPRQRQWRSFEEARAFVRGLGMRSKGAWTGYCKSGARPADVPSEPHETYFDKGWQGWDNWLGTDRDPAP